MPFDDQKVQAVGEGELGDFFRKVLERLRGEQRGKQEKTETKPHLLQVIKPIHGPGKNIPRAGGPLALRVSFERH